MEDDSNFDIVQTFFSYRASLMIPAAEFLFDRLVSGEGTANDLQIAEDLF
jgi:hypothetical protein